MHERLDRVLLNHNWLNIFPDCKIKHVARKCSDHNPILLSAVVSAFAGHKLFRFQNMWFLLPDFIAKVQDNWQLPARAVGLKKLWEKLHILKQFLSWWNKKEFENLFDKIKLKEEEVVVSEKAFIDCPSNANLLLFNNSSADFQVLMNMEEEFWG